MRISFICSVVLTLTSASTANALSDPDSIFRNKASRPWPADANVTLSTHYHYKVGQCGLMNQHMKLLVLLTLAISLKVHQVVLPPALSRDSFTELNTTWREEHPSTLWDVPSIVDLLAAHGIATTVAPLSTAAITSIAVPVNASLAQPSPPALAQLGNASYCQGSRGSFISSATPPDDAILLPRPLSAISLLRLTWRAKNVVNARLRLLRVASKAQLMTPGGVHANSELEASSPIDELQIGGIKHAWQGSVGASSLPMTRQGAQGRGAVKQRNGRDDGDMGQGVDITLSSPRQVSARDRPTAERESARRHRRGLRNVQRTADKQTRPLQHRRFGRSRKRLHHVRLHAASLFWALVTNNLTLYTDVAKAVRFNRELEAAADEMACKLRAKSRTGKFNGLHLRVEADWQIAKGVNASESRRKQDLHECSALMHTMGFAGSPLYIASAIFDPAGNVDPALCPTCPAWLSNTSVKVASVEVRQTLTSAGPCAVVPKGKVKGARKTSGVWPVKRGRSVTNTRTFKLHSEQAALLDFLVLQRADKVVGFGESSYSFNLREYRALAGRDRGTMGFVNSTAKAASIRTFDLTAVLIV